jgi:AcrR family transcriptional regulator
MPSQNASARSDLVARAPRRRRGRERVAALTAAATEVFADKGYDGATMTEVASRAGAAIGSLYQFFPTKESLAEALHAANAEALLQMLADLRKEVAGESAAELSDRLFQKLTKFLVAHPAFVALADRRSIDPKRKKELRARLRGQIITLLTEAKPPLPRERAQVMAVVILHLLRVAVSVSGETDLPNRNAVLAELRAMLRRHLGQM